MSKLLQYRIALLIGMLIVIPMGYFIRFAANGWLNDFLGSLAYETFWILLLTFLFPKWSLGKITLGVCLGTCAIEFLQLWQHPWYLAAKATFVGRLVLGNSFTWADFPPYFVGSSVGWLLVKILKAKILGLK
jgi:hypothetical protein